MTFNIDDLKKKIIYRSTYRGTKELDKLLSSFTSSIINELNNGLLIESDLKTTSLTNKGKLVSDYIFTKFTEEIGS